MKKFLVAYLAVSLGLAVAGCAKPYDDSELSGKLSKLDEKVTNLIKGQIAAMEEVVNTWKNGGYVVDIDNSVEGQHTITFDGGKKVVLYDGVDGINGTDGADGDAFFQSVTQSGDKVIFTLTDGTTYEIPFAQSFKLVLDNAQKEVAAGESVEFPYTIQGADDATAVDAFANGGYTVKIEADKVVVTAPTPATAGQVLVWAQNGEGRCSMVKLSFIVKAEFQVVTAAEELQAIPGDAGTFDIIMVSNVEPVIEIVPEGITWVKAVLTKAEYKVTLTLEENTTGEPREATVNVLRADNGDLIEAIKIVQLASVVTPMPDAAPGEILWAEDWTGGQANDTPAAYAQTGTTVFGGYKVTYTSQKPASGGSDIKLYDDDQMFAGTNQLNLLLSKNGGIWTIKGIPSGNATELKLTYKLNSKRNHAVTSTTEGVTIGERVEPTESSKPYTYSYPITLAEGVTKFDLVYTCSDGSNIRIDDVVLAVPSAEKTLTLERVWGFYKDGDTPWYSTSNITGASIEHPDGYGMARGLAMDDDYIYLPKSSGYANVVAVSITDKTNQKALNKTNISGGSIFATSFVRMIKNSDASVNGGKDVLLLCNLTATDSDAAQLRLYAYKDGVDAAPTQIAGFCYDSANNVNDWRRYGDRFFVTGDWSGAKVYFPSFNPNKIVCLSIANGARTGVQQIAAGESSPTGIKDLTVYPGSDKLFITNTEVANLVSPTGGLVNGWAEYSLTSSSSQDINTWGYNFFEFNGKKYIAYARLIGETKAQIEIIEDNGDLISSLTAKEGLMVSPINDATDLEKEVASGNLADCCVRIIGEEVYIAALTRDGGFVLDKMYLK